VRGDEHRGPALREGEERRPHEFSCHRIESAGRLVDEERGRVARELDRDGEAAPFSDGEITRMPHQALRELHAEGVQSQEPREALRGPRRPRGGTP
jgi:hypothetical protein